jgi:ribonuclease Z
MANKALNATGTFLSFCVAWTSQAQSKAIPKTQIVLLGAGTPLPDPERSGPCTAIIVNGTPYLVDLGTGVVRQAAAARQKGALGLDTVALRIGFITHLHSDLMLGLRSCLPPWVMGRKEPLELYGPPGTRAMVDNILKAYAADIQLRTAGLETPTAPATK